jgi:hypothetical protein
MSTRHAGCPGDGRGFGRSGPWGLRRIVVSLPLGGGEFKGLGVVEEGVWSRYMFVLVLGCMCLGLLICVALLGSV